MQKTYPFLLFVVCLCLLVFIFSCKQSTKNNNSNSESPQKISSNALKKNTHQLNTDSTEIKREKARKLYADQPEIYLNFPSNHAVACKIAVLPYTSDTNYDITRVYLEGQTYLNTIDSAYIIAQLKNIPQVVVNPDGGTSFGNFDGLDSLDCLDLDTDSRVGIVCAMRADSNFLCYIFLSHTNYYGANKGILAFMTLHGKILTWMVSDGQVTPEDPHGNINRDFTLLSANALTIEEGAAGDNSEHYGFAANYKVIPNKFILKKRKLQREK